MSKRVSKRADRIILSHALTGFICWYGIEKVFLRSIGISIFEISLFAIIYIAASAIFNIPTGIFADKYGRKYAILIAAVLLLVSTLTAGIAHSFKSYIVADICWGLFYTTQNGAYESLLYDTLKEENNEREYGRYSGLSSATFWFAIFVSSIVGAWIGSRYGLRKAYFITLIPNIINILLIFTLHEAHHSRAEQGSSLMMVKTSLRLLVSSPTILYTAGVYLLIALYSWMTNEFGQLFFIELVFSTFFVAFWNATSGLAQSIGNYFGHRFSRVNNNQIIIALLVLFALIFVLPLQLRYLATALFMVYVMVGNLFKITNDVELQRQLPSAIRTTTISALGVINDGLLVISYLTFGIIGQHTTVRKGFLAVWGYGLIMIVICKLIASSKRFKKASAQKYEGALVTDTIDAVPR